MSAMIDPGLRATPVNVILGKGSTVVGETFTLAAGEF